MKVGLYVFFLVIVLVRSFYVDKNKILTEANTWIGVTYHFGGKTKSGVDCSNFVHEVFLAAGYPYPMCSTACFRRGEMKNITKISRSQAKKGDIVVFDSTDGDIGKTGHAGILQEDVYNKFIGAQSSTGVAVTTYCDLAVDSSCTKYWGKDRNTFGYYTYDPLGEYVTAEVPNSSASVLSIALVFCLITILLW